MNKATCRGCGAPIVWIKTPAGKAMPCDPAPVYQNRTYKIHGRALLNLAAVLDELEPLPEPRQ